MTDRDATTLSIAPVRTRTRTRTRARRKKDTRALQQEILLLIMDGESVRAICDRDDMPCKRTVMNWVASDPDFRVGYAAAKALLAEKFAEEIIEISDDATNDWMERQRDDGSTDRVIDHEHVQRSRLRVDSRKWLAARLSPKRYGDSSMLKIGETESAPRRELTQTEAAARLAALVQSINKQKG